MKSKSVKAVLVMFTALALHGCSSTEVVRGPVQATIGQQLMDLKRAFDNGALSRSEYDDQRRRLINNVQ